MKHLSSNISIEVVNSLILSDARTANIYGYSVRVSSVRLNTFARKGTTCICCGCKGTHYIIDDNTMGPHLNLYSTDDQGKDTLMTRDHIVCKSHGGRNTVDNMNTMCIVCNMERGTKPLNTFLDNWVKPSVSVSDAAVEPRFSIGRLKLLSKAKDMADLGDVRCLFGILQTRANKYVTYPTEANLNDLVEHLKICKEYR